MTTVRIDDNRLEIKGHSGDHDVCGRVSTLLYHFLYNTADHYGLPFDSYVTEDATAVIRDLDTIRADARGAVMLDSLLYSLKLLAQDFPDFVRIDDRTK